MQKVQAISKLRARQWLLPLILLVAGTLGAGSAHALSPFFDPAKMITPEEVPQGTIATCKTVFFGTRVEEFHVEIVDLLPKINMGRDLVLFRVTDGPLVERQSPILAGMSGSPVYVNGRLLGAVSMGFPFSKEAIGMLTPINDMLEAMEQATGNGQQAMGNRREAPSPAQVSHMMNLERPITLAGRPYSRVMVAQTDWEPTERERETTAIFRPVATPVMCSGFSDAALKAFGDVLRPFNLLAVPGPGRANADAEISIEPGGALGVELVGGDIEAVAVGTVTYVDGDRFIAFGHPMFGFGQTNFPITTAVVNGFIPSYLQGVKIASAVKTVGVLSQDTNWAVGGNVGGSPSVIPFEVAVDQPDQGQSRVFRMEVCQNRFFSPIMFQLASMEALSSVLYTGRDATADVSIEIVTEGEGTIRRANRVFDEMSVVPPLLRDFFELLSLCSFNEFKRVPITSARLSCSVRDERREATLENIVLDDYIVRPGETLAVNAILRTKGGQRFTQRLEVLIPEDTPTGPLELAVCAGQWTLLVEQSLGALRAVPEDFPGLLRLFQSQPSNNELVAILMLADTGVATAGVEFPSLPLEMATVFAAAGTTDLLSGMGWREVRVPSDYVLEGIQIHPVLVVRPEDKIADVLTGQRGGGGPPGPQRDFMRGPEPRMDLAPWRMYLTADPLTATFQRRLCEEGVLPEDMVLPSAGSGMSEPWSHTGRSWSSLIDRSLRRGHPSRFSEGAGLSSRQAGGDSQWLLPLQGPPPMPPGVPPLPRGIELPVLPPEGAGEEGPSPSGTKEGKEEAKATARGPQVWSETSRDDFAAGTLEGVAVTDDGELVLSSPLEPLVTRGEALYLWDMALDGDGNLFVGSGNAGRILKITREGEVSTFARVDDLEVFSLAFDADGHLYAGTGPQGKVYRLSPSGEAALVADLDENYVWDMVASPDGFLYLGTGPNGRILRLAPDGQTSVVFDSSEGHINVLQLAEDGSQYAGTGDRGSIIKIDPDGSARTLCQSPQGAIHALALDSDGNVFFGALSDEDEAAMYKLDHLGNTRAILKSTDASIMAMTVDASGKIYAGTGTLARIFVRDKEDHVSLLGQAEQPESQFLSLALDESRGALYACTANPAAVYKLPLSADRTGQFTSQVFDTGGPTRWGRISFTAAQPEGTTVSVQTRSGNTKAPDETWSDWSGPDLLPGGEAVLSPGAQFLQYRVTLHVGEAGESPVFKAIRVVYLKNNEKPTVNFSLADSEDWIHGEQEVAWEGEDPDGDELEYTLYISADDGATWKVLAEKLTEATHSWDTTAESDGTYLLKVVASDRRGNPVESETAEAISKPIVVDNSPPRVLLPSSAVEVTEEGKVSVSASAMDKVSGIRSAQYRVDEGEWQAIAAEDFLFDSVYERFRFSTDPLEPGTHVIEIKVFDAAGNEATQSREATVPERAEEGQLEGTMEAPPEKEPAKG